MDFKVQWLEETYLVFDHCMNYLQPVALDANTPQEMQDRICKKMLGNLEMHLRVLGIMQRVRVIPATDSDGNEDTID